MTFIYREVVKVGESGCRWKYLELAADFNIDILLLLVYALAHRSSFVPNPSLRIPSSPPAQPSTASSSRHTSAPARRLFIRQTCVHLSAQKWGPHNASQVSRICMYRPIREMPKGYTSSSLHKGAKPSRGNRPCVTELPLAPCLGCICGTISASGQVDILKWSPISFAIQYQHQLDDATCARVSA
jgi:hypothetical protein